MILTAPPLLRLVVSLSLPSPSASPLHHPSFSRSLFFSYLPSASRCVSSSCCAPLWTTSFRACASPSSFASPCPWKTSSLFPCSCLVLFQSPDFCSCASDVAPVLGPSSCAWSGARTWTQSPSDHPPNSSFSASSPDRCRRYCSSPSTPARNGTRHYCSPSNSSGASTPKQKNSPNIHVTK